jgi:hypothetical protein
LHGLNPAERAELVEGKKRKFSGRAGRALQEGRQKTPVVTTA